MWALCDLVLLSLNIGLSANEWLSKGGTTCAIKTLSRFAPLLGLPSKTCKSNWQLTEKYSQTFPSPPPNALVPIACQSWKTVFYATRGKRGHPQGAITIYFLLTNGLVSNYEYSNGDGIHRWRTYSCGRFMGLIAHKGCSLSRMSTVLTDTWPPKFTFWCIKTIYPGISGYYPILSRCSSAGRARSHMFTNHSSRWQTLHKTTNYNMAYPHFPCHHYIHKTCRDILSGFHLSAKVNFCLTIIERWIHYIRKLYNRNLQHTYYVIMYNTNWL